MMKKILYLLLCLPLAFMACQPESDDTVKSNYLLTLTSDQTMSFGIDGGEGVITYDITETRAAELKVEATCDAKWISDLKVDDNITFVVAANDGDTRQTKIVVKYGDQSFEVAIEQTDGIMFEAKVLTGEYYGEYYTPDAGNYYISFSDKGFDEGGNRLSDATYYQLDLYGELFEGEAENGFIPIPEGKYKLDLMNTMALGTIGYDYSRYIKDSHTEQQVETSFDAAELVVDADGNYTLSAIISGQKHYVKFSGESTIADKRHVNDIQAVEFNVDCAYGIYYGDQFTEDFSDNFHLYLSDKGFDEDGRELPDAMYFRFDLYSQIIDKENGIAIPYGKYVFDNTDSGNPNTISTHHSGYYKMDAEAMATVEAGAFTSGNLVIDENGVVAEFMMSGVKCKVTFNGAISQIKDASSGGGGGDGYYSTLADDYNCKLDDHTLYYMYYGDYYGVGYHNWTFLIKPNSNMGDHIQFDVLAGPNSTEDFLGTYTLNDSHDAFTAITGVIQDDYMQGAWYYTNDGTTMAPFTAGTLTIVDSGDDTISVEFDVVDDCGHKVTGSWTGKIRHASELSSVSATRLNKR